VNNFPPDRLNNQATNEVAPVCDTNGIDPMCEKCVKLDEKIEHYRGMTLAIGDQLTVEQIKALIEDLQAQKAVLHPEQEQ
jgi:hypothetical protein